MLSLKLGSKGGGGVTATGCCRCRGRRHSDLGLAAPSAWDGGRGQGAGIMGGTWAGMQQRMLAWQPQKGRDPDSGKRLSQSREGSLGPGLAQGGRTVQVC